MIDFEKDSVESLSEGEVYDISFFVESVKDERDKNPPRVPLFFEDGEGNTLRFTLWVEDRSEEMVSKFESGQKYKLTNIKHTMNGIYHNFHFTDETEVSCLTSKGDLEDELSTAQPDNPGLNTDGHFITRFKSVSNNRVDTLFRYTVVPDAARDVSSKEERYKLMEGVKRKIYEKGFDAVAVSDELTVTSLSRLDEVEFNGFELEESSEVSLDFECSQHRSLYKTLVEELIKNELSDKFLVRGIDEILSTESVYETDSFELRGRYSLSVSITSSGEIVLDIYYRHRYISNLFVSDYSNRLEGLYVEKCYGQQKSYQIIEVTDKTVNDKITKINNKSVVEYFDEKEPVSDDLLAQIKQSNNPLVKVRPRSKTGNDLIFPQEVLKVSPDTSQLDKVDEEFQSEASRRQNTTPSHYWDQVQEFITNHNMFSTNREEIRFETEPVSNQSSENIKKLYPIDEKTLQFGDGTGSHPKDLFNKDFTVYETPDQPKNIAVISPKDPFLSTAKDRIESTISILEDKGCMFNEIQYIPYDPSTVSMETFEIDLINKINNDVELAICVLTGKNIAGLFSPPLSYNEQYNKGKQILAENGIWTQMVNSESIREQASLSRIKENLAIGILGKLGVIPYSPIEKIPGEADLFIGVDVATGFNQGKGDKLSIAAASMAVLNDGTIFGWESEQSQRGEKIDKDHLRTVVRRSIRGYQEQKGTLPNHVVIHRDGFLHESLDEVKDLLESQNISFDAVSIRKDPITRILNFKNNTPTVPDKGIAVLDNQNERAILSTWGNPEGQATSDYTGTPRPIQVEKIHGDTDIETIARQVYLLSESHIGATSTTIRLPITTYYADKIGTYAMKNHLVANQSGINKRLGFL